MTNVSDKSIEQRIKRLEERIYGDLQFPDDFEYPDDVGGGGGMEVHDNEYHDPNYAEQSYVDGREWRTFGIPTTNLADGEEIRLWFHPGINHTHELIETMLVNDAGQAPDGLDVVVHNFADSTEVYRDGSRHSYAGEIQLDTDKAHYLAIENNTGAEQNASCTAAIKLTLTTIETQ